MSLSMPLGPNVDLTASTTAQQALMLLISCALPWLVSVPSLSRIIWGCCRWEDNLTKRNRHHSKRRRQGISMFAQRLDCNERYTMSIEQKTDFSCRKDLHDTSTKRRISNSLPCSALSCVLAIRIQMNTKELGKLLPP